VEFVLWTTVVALFALSLIGVFLPVIPDTIPLWAGFLVYQFVMATPGEELSYVFWTGIVIMTILLIGADLLANLYFVKKYGGSKWSSLGAMAGIILGIFIFPPIGMIVLPFVFVFLIELSAQKQPVEKAVKVAFGTLVAFLGSAVVKVGLQLVMIGWFFLDIFVF